MWCWFEDRPRDRWKRIGSGNRLKGNPVEKRQVFSTNDDETIDIHMQKKKSLIPTFPLEKN